VCLVNYCCLYLQAVTNSDISNASGSRSFWGIQKGNTTKIQSPTAWHHTVQAKPSATSWKQWKQACTLFTTSGILHDQLEEWLVPHHEQLCQWPDYFDPCSDRLLDIASQPSPFIYLGAIITLQSPVAD
jgi:hypothetical protein